MRLLRFLTLLTGLLTPLLCQANNTLTIAAVGDILLHQPLQMKAVRYGFISLWEQALPVLRAADITYGNLEGPMAQGVTKTGKVVNDDRHMWDNYIYSSYPLFNYHPNLAQALKESGFDVVSTANNHTLDRYAIGIDKTIKTLNSTGIQFTGTRSRDTNNSWYAITQGKGFKVAWISCTVDTNGMRDKHDQVLYCYTKKGRTTVLRLIQKLKSETDAVIVTPHWGTQYQHQPSRSQKHFAKQVLDAGALAVIGSHPHVLQPIKRYITKDNRNTMIAYSMGNFVSYQGSLKNRATGILLLTLNRNESGITEIQTIKFIPAYMQNRNGMKNITLKLLDTNKPSTALQEIKRVISNKFIILNIDN